MRCQSLPELCLLARQRTNSGGQSLAFGSNGQDNITDAELTSYYNIAIGSVWSMLLSKQSVNYNIAFYTFPINGNTFSYPLPYDFKAVVACDAAFSNQGASNNWISVKPYNIHDRNMFSYTTPLLPINTPWTNIRYKTDGNNMSFIPNTGPLPGTIRIWYYQCTPILCSNLPQPWIAGQSYTQGSLVTANLTPVNAQPVTQAFVALNNGTAGSVSPSQTAVIGAGSSAVTYTSTSPTAIWNIIQSAGTAGVTVSGNTITVLIGSDTAGQIATLVNAVGIDGVSASGAGGAASAGTASINPWQVPGTTVDNNITWAYKAPSSLFATTMDFINAWEELAIIEVCIMICTKQMKDYSAFMAQKQTLIQRMEPDVSDRISGDPQCITPAWGGGGWGNDGMGWGSGNWT